MRALLLCLLLPFAADAQCRGQNLINALPADQRAALQAAAAAAPFASGNIWQATRGAQVITLIGTYHLDDPRHDALVAAVAPALAAARTLLVEAGPAEQAALRAALAGDPALLTDATGPTLPEAPALPETPTVSESLALSETPTLSESLAPRDWLRLTDALQARDIPPAFAARLRPWYLATVLAVPVCQLALAAGDQGLDKRLMARAAAQGIPVKGLEPHDTIFTVFDSFSRADQISLLRQTVDTTGPVEADMAVTLTDSYFAGESRLFWEFSRHYALTLPGYDPADIIRQFALLEDGLMTRRNRAWMPVILAEAAQGPVVVAVGALHLAGEAGVLNLLQAGGYTVTPW